MAHVDVFARCRTTAVVNTYINHHICGNLKAPRGLKIKRKTFSKMFLEARRLTGYIAEDGPTLHEIRSLSKQLYIEQDGVDTKALLGHLTHTMPDLYANL
ncbi:hypothetical protein D3C86_806700 [compost metagenome]